MALSSSVRGYKLALIVCAAVALLALGARLAQHWGSQHYNHAAEANGLYGLLEAADGNELYPGPAIRPYHIFLYGPVQPLVTAGALQALGVEALAARVAVARGLCLFLAAVAIALLWLGMARPAGVSGPAFALAALLASPWLVDYATTARSDTWALSAELATAAAFLAWMRSGRMPWIATFLALGWISLFTRQTGVFAVGAAGLWLLVSRRYLAAIWLGITYVVGVALLVTAAQFATGMTFLDHVWFANLRDNPSFWEKLMQPSFLSFLGTHVGLASLAAVGLRPWLTGERKNEALYLLLVAATSGLAGTLLVARAGGDVNYLLEAILVGTIPAALGIERLSQMRWRDALITAQLVLIAVVTCLKLNSARQVTSLDYKAAAEAVRLTLPEPGILAGALAPSLGIHLRGWAWHGPDVSNFSQIARHAHKRMRWVLKDLRAAIRTGEVKSLVIAQSDCGPNPAHGRDIPLSPHAWPQMDQMPSPVPWLCLYQFRPGTVPVPTKRNLSQNAGKKVPGTF